jgi:hypothetical protein
MIESLLGWSVFVVLLALPCVFAQEIVLRGIRWLRPGYRVRLPARAAIVCAGAFGLWLLIPDVVHAILGRAAH